VHHFVPRNASRLVNDRKMYAERIVNNKTSAGCILLPSRHPETSVVGTACRPCPGSTEWAVIQFGRDRLPYHYYPTNSGGPRNGRPSRQLDCWNFTKASILYSTFIHGTTQHSFNNQKEESNNEIVKLTKYIINNYNNRSNSHSDILFLNFIFVLTLGIFTTEDKNIIKIIIIVLAKTN